MIQNMQTSHAHQISELREQYVAVSAQLEQLKSLLNDHFTSQRGSLHLLQSVSVQLYKVKIVLAFNQTLG